MSPPLPSKDPVPPSLRERLRGSFSQTRRTLALVWASSRRGTIALAVLTVISAALAPSIAYVGKLIVDAVVAARAAEGAAVGPALDHCVRVVALELALIVAAAFVERMLGLSRQLVGARLGVDVNLMILRKALTLGLRDFENPTYYDKLTRARREASSRPLALVSENFQILRNGLTLAGYVALLVGFSPWLVGVVLLASIPAFVSEAAFSVAGFRLRNRRAPETRRLNYLEYVAANDEHAKEVKLFGLGPTLVGRYQHLADRLYAEDRRLAIRRTFWGWGLSLLSTIAFYGCYAFIVVATVRGRLSLGDMMLYLVAFRQGQQAFQSILTALGGMYEHTLYMSNLFDFLTSPISDAPDARPGPATGNGAVAITAGNGARAVTAGNGAAAIAGGNGAKATPLLRNEAGIRFEKVGFRYPDSPGWALRHIDLFIPKGQSLALVGENGAGKTTFIKLLTRLYLPTEGRILLDGRDLRDWDEAGLRGRFGVIFQDFNQYHFLLRENVGLGSIQHLDDEGRIHAAIERGGAAELVETLTRGLDTQLGRWFKDGVELSGGQWQKVALARAFMRQEADILILDEPTAALDARAEHAVFQRFRTLAEGRTTIVISHRFPTVRMADRIVVIERGSVIETGTHAELVAAKGRYAHLFALQAEGYL